MKKKDRRTPIMKQTTDDFCGNFNGNTVQLSYHGWISDCRSFRISVWGNDDYGMIFDTPDRVTAEKIFDKLKQSSIITKAELKALGFED